MLKNIISFGTGGILGSSIIEAIGNVNAPSWVKDTSQSLLGAGILAHGTNILFKK